MHRGWVRLWRKSGDSAAYTDDLWRLFCHCVMRANYRPTKVFVHGLASPVDVGIGQFITGRHALHAELYPRKTKSAPSPNTVWRRLVVLQNLGNLGIQTSSRFTIVTVYKFETYNPAELESEQANGQPVGSRWAAGGQPVGTEKKVKKVKKVKKEKATPSCSEPPQAASSEPADSSESLVVLTYPTVGKGSRTWDLSKAKLNEYLESFPGVDVLAECRLALQWCRDNPKKRKTPSGMPAFLASWLGRTQNRGGGGSGNQATRPGQTVRRSGRVHDPNRDWDRSKKNQLPKTESDDGAGHEGAGGHSETTKPG